MGKGVSPWCARETKGSVMLTGKWAIPVVIVVALSGLSSPAIADPAETPAVTVAAVGDIACSPTEREWNDGQGSSSGCRQEAVADVVRDMNPAAFLALGDIQHHNGTYAEFMSSYDPTFGDLKPITRPIPGNHEYNTPGGAGYYQYFGAAANQQSNGNYSFRVGSWHVLAINSTACTPTRSCGPGSPMAKWIAAEVAANPTQCLAAMWHHPVWSAGNFGNNTPMVPVWNQLHSYGADLTLHGHDHSYQRSQPLGPASVTSTGAVADPVVTGDGMRQFIVATGGQNNFRVPAGNQATTDAMAVIGANADPAVFGALQLRLGDGQYSFDFVPAQGVTFTDSGSATCRQKTPPTDIPAKPSVTVTRSGDGTVTVGWAAQRWADRLPVTYTARLVGRSRQCVSTENSCTISGLTNGQTYTVVVTASNDIADIVSEPVSFVPAVKPTRPGTPSATVSGDQVDVSWPASSYNGGLGVSYRVTTTPGAKTCTTTATSCRFLLAAGTYRFTVTAVNEVGESAGVTSAAVVVSAPPTPVITAVARAGDGRITVTLAEPPNPTFSDATYVVRSTPSSKSCTTTGTACTVTGLTNGVSYTFTAVLRTSTMTSAVSTPSSALVAARVPVRPAAPAVAVVGPGAVTLSWSPPTYDGGLPVTAYEVLVGNGPRMVCTTSALSCTATGLAAGSYWFTVVAINEAGRSANSSGSATVRVS